MADPEEEKVRWMQGLSQKMIELQAAIRHDGLSQQITDLEVYYAFRNIKDACRTADPDELTAALDSVSGHDWSHSVNVCYIMPHAAEKRVHIKTICRLMLTFGLISSDVYSLGAICHSYGDIYDARFPFNLLRTAVDYGLFNSVSDDESRLYIFNSNRYHSHETFRAHRLKIVLEAGVSPYVSTPVVTWRSWINHVGRSNVNMWKMMVEADF